VTSPNALIQQQGKAAQQLIEQASALWVTAAEQSDSADGLGIDARINLIHSLVDLWVKGCAAVVQALIAGPIYSPGPSTDLVSVPQPSEPITVPPQPYLRKLTAFGPFERLGSVKTTIPTSCIRFKPEILDENGTTFRIMLADYGFAGANYSGKVVLTRTDGLTVPPPDELAVTVGL
jgi:hypothetical protein